MLIIMAAYKSHHENEGKFDHLHDIEVLINVWLNLKAIEINRVGI